MSFEKKIDVIKKRTAELERKVNSLADAFLKTLIENFVDRLDVKDGVIQNTPGNIALLGQIDKLFLQFNAQVAAPAITETIAKGVEEIHGYNTDYFSTLAKDRAKYKATSKQVGNIIMDRLGFGEKTRLKPGGFMDTLFKDPTVANQVKNLTRTEMIKGIGFQQFKSGLQKMIKTDGNSIGAFERHYRTYAYDIFVNVDREESLLTAKALDLKYFIYSGTIIDSSRDFCIKRAGKVFTAEEAELWRNDKWIENALKKGYIASYDPIRDMGLFGCRHVPQFVPKEVAERIRPDLKGPAQPTPEPPKPPTPEPRVESSFKPGKNLKETKANFVKAIGDDSGLKFSSPTVSSELDLEAFTQRAKVVADLFAEYQPNPAINDKKEIELVFRSTSSNYGVVSTEVISATVARINFGHKYDKRRIDTFDPEKPYSQPKSLVDPGNVEISTTVHEFAHVLFVSHHKTFSSQKVQDFSDSLKLIRDQYRKEIKELSDKGDNKGISEIYLGQYAGTHVDEFMAEAFTEYRLNSNPSKYAKKVGQLIDKTFKK